MQTDSNKCKYMVQVNLGIPVNRSTYFALNWRTLFKINRFPCCPTGAHRKSRTSGIPECYKED